MSNYDYIEMKVPAKPEYVGVARLTLSGVANRMGFSYESIEDLKVAVSEAITNAVNHAYNDNESGEINIGFGIYEDHIEIMIADRGESFDLEKIKQETGPYHPEEPVEKLREGGFGLFLIEALMDDVKINNQYGVMIMMSKYIAEEEVDMDDDQISTTQ
ncbi:negative regulator of sigma-B activity (switch protein/serine kinase, anti-sigma factor) [Oceanobacillus iheyensis HTE831]|uniref:Serine-protein kinase RsbW n=1 Tax=Oceanobacillus iheyensis (strain DSM 14371 / CIP 107618 / JCM 11309 / KCTC 3954 / HTE831) TaxID=221109 RepID=RSBW_OCEIH|nr:anti-sigma B factor RsbW [Oceanobacillus iheyensis]Q8CXL7.1 RecName: Full=Serine-protein kinase RsbW; AltName: Full=Anti-sigma-B factor; AltName: Full=Sigma-B negative effector RsbW [Oceanobacillus iheyensis HTE831]BAC12585.1 negative regulator of sigma-B activity (switch protein/serine kinase, anti-sigma factor) [Oceanobacillus iheyensis HTE831]